MNALARWLIVVPAAVALAWLARDAARDGVAGSIVFDSAREIATWEASGNEPGFATVSWIAGDLLGARNKAPGDANVEELLGALALRLIDRPEYAEEALVHFQRAALLRPTSPYTWASMVDARYQKGDTGPGFEAALRRAEELGPAEPEVQRTVADFGLAVWDDLAPETQRAVEAAVTGAMRRDPREILQIGERRGRLALVCRHLADAPRRVDPEWLQPCSREATS